MAATVTLSTTTLAESVDAHVGLVKLASTSGIFPDTRLWVSGELLRVIRLGIDPWVLVTRGADGTKGTAHLSGETVYIGTADQFYAKNPQGIPPSAIPVSPHINVLEGKVWFARGDALPHDNANRWWQLQTVTHGAGPLGVITTTYDPTSST